MRQNFVIPAQAGIQPKRRGRGISAIAPQTRRYWFPAFAGMTFFLFLAFSALADTSTPLLYTRATISIIRKNPPQKATPSLPWQKDAPTPPPVAEPAALTFEVEVRDAMTLYNQKGWFNLSSPSEQQGILMMFAKPGTEPIKPMTQYAPLDILLIDREGTILQIIPNIKLSELIKEIVPQSPVLAFLFLKGGVCQKWAINPGDAVDYALFQKPPLVLSVPISKSPPP